MKEKISVIMPLFNAAVYLRESLDSVLQQTFMEFKLICINDASADATGDILAEYQKKDARIQVLTNNEHLGAAYSRNIGIKEAKGEYLSFLDGDDIFEEEMLETAYQAAVEKDAEVVIFDYKHVPSEVIYEKKVMQHSDVYQKKYCRTLFSISDNEPYEFIIWSASPWNKLFNRKFIEENSLEFQNLSSSNDVYFVLMALFLSQKIFVLPDNRVMVYVREHNQPARISYDRNPMCAYQAMEKVKKELKIRGLFHKTANYYYYHAYQHLFVALTRTKSQGTAKKFYRFLQNEGISRLCSCELLQKKYADEYICSKMNQFLTKSFESEWYKYESILNIYLEKQQNLLEKLFFRCCENKIRIGVWGAGINGRILIKFCNQHHLKIDMVVDSDKNKQGKWQDDYLILNPESAYGKIQVMVISAQFIYQEVKETIRQYDDGMKVIDILQFLNII